LRWNLAHDSLNPTSSRGDGHCCDGRALHRLDRNKGLFTFASYNAGPARIRQLRQEAARRGLDSNVWINNVEIVAAEKIGAETVTYVANIYKHYITYRLVVEAMERQKKQSP
jgi:membrane-bound lytic murein transglycosylase MltF